MISLNLIYPRPLLFLLIAVLASGCNEGIDDLRRLVDNAKNQPVGRVEPIPEFLPYQNFEYTSQDLRDPFKLVDFRRPEENIDAINNIADGPKPDIDRPREALEDFPLDTLRLKGSVTKNGNKWGLIFAPDNTIHRVVEGNYIGQNHGRIISVADTIIEIIEIVPDGLGNYIERTAALAVVE